MAAAKGHKRQFDTSPKARQKAPRSPKHGALGPPRRMSNNATLSGRHMKYAARGVAVHPENREFTATSNAQTTTVEPSGRTRSFLFSSKEDMNTQEFPDLDFLVNSDSTFQVETPHAAHVFMPNHPYTRAWDGIVCLALIWTALVTSFEIALLETNLTSNSGVTLFACNRIFDFVFLIDIYVGLKSAYLDHDRGEWVTNRVIVAKRYLKGWFCIDVVTLVPWDVIAFCMERGSDDGAVGNTRILRLLKIAKIAKLMRIIKAAKVFHQIAAMLMLSSTSKQLCKYLSMILLCTHWIACAWAFVSKLQASEPSILINNTTDSGLNSTRRVLKGSSGSSATDSDLDLNAMTWVERKEAELQVVLSVADIYCISLEYSLSVMCMGYATIPITSTERWLSVFCMLFAGSLYAYVVGGICAAIAAEDPAVQQFEENNDMLMTFLEDHQIPHDLRIRAFEYYAFSKNMLRNQCHVQVLDFLAPSIRGLIAQKIHGEWISKVPFLNPEKVVERSALIKQICLVLKPCAFPPAEPLYTMGEHCEDMYIVERGMVVELGMFGRFHMRRSTSFFGSEALECFIGMEPVRATTVRTLSYVILDVLNVYELADIVNKRPTLFSGTNRLIRLTIVRGQLRRKMCAIGRAAINALIAMDKLPSRDERQKLRKKYLEAGKANAAKAAKTTAKTGSTRTQMKNVNHFVYDNFVHEPLDELSAMVRNCTGGLRDLHFFKYPTKIPSLPRRKTSKAGLAPLDAPALDATVVQSPSAENPEPLSSPLGPPTENSPGPTVDVMQVVTPERRAPVLLTPIRSSLLRPPSPLRYEVQALSAGDTAGDTGTDGGSGGKYGGDDGRDNDRDDGASTRELLLRLDQRMAKLEAAIARKQQVASK
jgi:potassium voltage-gated channel Eag-related subfamily H protein 7